MPQLTALNAGAMARKRRSRALVRKQPSQRDRRRSCMLRAGRDSTVSGVLNYISLCFLASHSSIIDEMSNNIYLYSFTPKIRRALETSALTDSTSEPLNRFPSLVCSAFAVRSCMCVRRSELGSGREESEKSDIKKTLNETANKTRKL